jgi:hypothetical protein
MPCPDLVLRQNRPKIEDAPSTACTGACRYNERPIEGKAATRRIELRFVAGRKYSLTLGALVKLVRVYDWH